MPRLRNRNTKVVVSVSDETAARLDSEWEPVKGGDSATKSTKAPAVATSETPDNSWSIAKLTQFAKDNGIDLGKAKKKDEILPLVAAAKPATSSGDGDNGSGDNAGDEPAES